MNRGPNRTLGRTAFRENNPHDITYFSFLIDRIPSNSDAAGLLTIEKFEPINNAPRVPVVDSL